MWKAYTGGEKRPQILNVGRFFAGNHNKKHLVMVEAFKHMVDQGLTGWTLHLAGGTTSGEEHKAYLDSVFEQANHYPITVHPDIPFAELSELYSTSAIYWHASGFGEDDQREPEKYEHFGITTVEAMAAGCVPVVIAKGGQPEIVQHGENGFCGIPWMNCSSYPSAHARPGFVIQIVPAGCSRQPQICYGCVLRAGKSINCLQ